MFRSGTSFNRTILELKCSSRSSLSSFVRPSIAPYWNWNYSSPRTLMTGSYLQSHHTGIEIRKFDSKRLPTYCPSIAPYWNWNEWSSSSHDLAAIPSIAPYWNWNFFLLLRRQFCHIPSIAPYWNWNSGYTAVNWLRDLPSIAPYWNWNRLSLAVSWEIFLTLQSHHTGIEIIKGRGMPSLSHYLQSHHTGIEIAAVATIRCVSFCDLQSHHTGIEINKGTRSHIGKNDPSIAPYWNWNSPGEIGCIYQKLAFNRTILELKSGYGGPPYGLLPPLQSHHTGIEMCNNKLLFCCWWPSIAPYWNWNAVKKAQKEDKGEPSIAPYWNWNAERIDLLPQSWYLQSHHTGIEIYPEWVFRSGKDIPSIAPYWNWNSSMASLPSSLFVPSIAPYWNWNTLSGDALPHLANSFNRTILELKYYYSFHDTAIDFPSIAPYWNWNRRTSSIKR